MAGWETELLHALEKEQALLDALLAQARQKAAILKDEDIAALDAVVNREQPLLLQLQAAQQARIHLLAAHGMDGAALRRAAGQAGAARQSLFGLLDHLVDTARQLQKQNTRNGAVVQARLSQYDAVARRLLPPRTLYTQQGRAPEAPAGKMLIDRKI